MKHKIAPVFVLGLLLLGITLIIQERTTDEIWKASDPRIKIMPLGDSITQGGGDRDTYRRPLWKLLKRSNPRVDFIGSMQMNYPNVRPAHSDFDVDHEGHWGWRTDNVLYKLDGWIKHVTPDIVLLHLGTNDMNQNQGAEDTIEELKQIILILRKHNPRVEIFLAQLIPTINRNTNMRIRELNDRLPYFAQSITTDDAPVFIVNHYEGFDAYKDTYDGTHPNESGIAKMAQKWHDVLSEHLGH